MAKKPIKAVKDKLIITNEINKLEQELEVIPHVITDAELPHEENSKMDAVTAHYALIDMPQDKPFHAIELPHATLTVTEIPPANEFFDDESQAAPEPIKAHILEDFTLFIRMLGHRTAGTNVFFKKGTVITKANTVRQLQMTSKPVHYE